MNAFKRNSSIREIGAQFSQLFTRTMLLIDLGSSNNTTASENCFEFSRYKVFLSTQNILTQLSSDDNFTAQFLTLTPLFLYYSLPWRQN